MNKRLFQALKEMEEYFSTSKVMEIRVLSNRLMDEAAIENDHVMAEVALVGYSLHKLSTKAHIVGHDKWIRVKRNVLASLEKAGKALKENKKAEFEKTINGIVKDITRIDAELGNFVQGLYEKARIKYAVSAYSLGLSLSQAAALTGARKDNVLSYIGATKISDREEIGMGIEARLKKLRAMM